MRTLAYASFALGLAACGGTPASFTGTLSISSPKNNDTVAATDGKISVAFDTNYVLKPAGGCNGQTGCGSVFLQVDGAACYASGKAYNVDATVSPTDVDLTLCPTVAGTHTISAELRQDDAAQDFVENNVTKDPITSSVTITVTQ
jgi:hypothetical protein